MAGYLLLLKEFFNQAEAIEPPYGRPREGPIRIKLRNPDLPFGGASQPETRGRPSWNPEKIEDFLTKVGNFFLGLSKKVLDKL